MFSIKDERVRRTHSTKDACMRKMALKIRSTSQTKGGEVRITSPASEKGPSATGVSILLVLAMISIQGVAVANEEDSC